MLKKSSLLALLFLLVFSSAPIFSDNGRPLEISLDNYLRLKKNNQRLLKEYEKQKQQLQEYKKQLAMLEKLSNSNIKLLNDWKKQIDSYIEIYKEAYKKQLTRLSKLETQLQSIQTRLKQVESSLEKMPEYFKKLERAHTAAVIKTGLMSTGIGIGIAVIGGVAAWFFITDPLEIF